MISPSSQAVGDGLGPLSHMPTELMTRIFSLLPAFPDVFALAATCHRLKYIWTTNTTAIYSQVAPRCIPCEPYARSFLVDQGGLTEECSLLSAEDVGCLLRNSWVIEKAIPQFEREIVRKVSTGPWDAEKSYGAGARRHPPYLTRTERSRFIRSYYQLWGMMRLDVGEWQARLEAMSLKQVVLLYEMSRLTQSIGLEEAHSENTKLDADPKSQHPTSFRRSDKRQALSRRIREHMEHTYRRIHNEDFDDPWVNAKEDGYLWFVVMWDHWQTPFEDLICRRSGQTSRSARSFDGPGIWDDSSDEEIQA